MNWSPIKKEMLAIVFITRKFREYILGKPAVVQTDHNPLETILCKPVTTAQLRLQAMRLKVSGYDLKLEYLPGKKHVLGDTLSRSRLNEVPLEEDELQVKESQSQKLSMQNSRKTQQMNSVSCTL